MANEWDSYASEWENEPATHVFAQSAFNELTKLTSLSGLRVLDFGCGTGLLSQKMSPLVKNIVALDSSEEMIEELDHKELLNVEPVVDELSRGLVAQHPAFRKQFDMIVASSVCGFIPQLQDTMSVIYSLMDKGSLFVHWDWLTDDSDEYGLSVAQIDRVLKATGFEDVEVCLPFEIETKQGVQQVVMGIARK